MSNEETYRDETLQLFLRKGNVKKTGCSCCEAMIDVDIVRLEYSFVARRASKTIRICPICISKIDKLLSKQKGIKEWKKKVTLQQI